jgi:peptide/nickel transport system substrate-binding protein
MGIARYLAVRWLALGLAIAAPGSELRFCVHADPKTFDPLLASEEASQTIAYLTGGVLMRLNRRDQHLQPELATAWKVSDGGKRIDFTLRQGVRFSDGSPFRPEDVVATISRLADPKLISAIADTFRSAAGDIKAAITGPFQVSIYFAAPRAGLDQLFDQLVISHATALPQSAVLGPFAIEKYEAGAYVLLRRNQNYWKTASGGKLPYLDTIRLEIQANRDNEVLRFRRGEIDFLDKVDPDAFERLRKEMPEAALRAGPSLDAEVFWFNQSPAAAYSAYKQKWFGSKAFRQAISLAVNRADIVRLAYSGNAHVAFGPISDANRLWFNSHLPAPACDPARALKLLERDGFRLENGTLRDRERHEVEFSLITNAGSATRARIGAMLQQDLAKIGMRVTFTPIEFQSLVERITSTQRYEACLLGLSNSDIDPNEMMNVWLSSGTHHAWNPRQNKPATAWEAEMDRLAQSQAAAPSFKDRRIAFDRIQEILVEQAPIVYLVYPDVLVAVSPRVRGAEPSALSPHLFWNIETLSLAPTTRRPN